MSALIEGNKIAKSISTSDGKIYKDSLYH